MQRIELDFIRRGPRSRWPGRVLLACALGLAGDLAASYVRLAQTVNENEAIVARAPARKLKEVARANGTLPLREAAMRLVNNAETSLEEINRVTFVA